MADLSAYISFTVVLDKSGVTPSLTVFDTSTYPIGVPPLIKGCLSVTQPDGLTVANTNFASPDIQWTGSGLNPKILELRLNTINGFQTGGYLITYSVQATGYTQTNLTQTFNLSYTKPVAIIGSNFNIFTPVLTVTDETNYAQTTMTLLSANETWAGVIDSVMGTTQNISGTGLTFDLNYLGNYYDANYAITLTTIATWQLISSTWVTVVDLITTTQSFDSETPPSVSSLLASLTFLKAQLDAATCNCNTYPKLLANYLLAETTYSHFRFRGCDNSFSGLVNYVLQLQKIFNNNVTPTVTHTNAIIPAYDFACGAGSVTWNSITGKPSTVIIEWTVGQVGFPIAGSNTLTDARLIGYNVLVLRNNIQELGFTKSLGSPNVVFNQAFTTNEVIYIQSIPL